MCKPRLGNVASSTISLVYPLLPRCAPDTRCGSEQGHFPHNPAQPIGVSPRSFHFSFRNRHFPLFSSKKVCIFMMDIYVSGRNIWYPIMVYLTHEKDKNNLKKGTKIRMSQWNTKQEVSSVSWTHSIYICFFFLCLSICFISSTLMDCCSAAWHDPSSGSCLHISTKLHVVMNIFVIGAFPGGVCFLQKCDPI